MAMPFDGLSDDQIRSEAPSVFATHPSDKVSDKYAYLPSYHVVRAMRKKLRRSIKEADGRRSMTEYQV